MRARMRVASGDMGGRSAKEAELAGLGGVGVNPIVAGAANGKPISFVV